MVKVISLSEEAYKEIRAMKHHGDSFSDVVLRMAGKNRKKSILDLAGRWKITQKEAENIKKTITDERKKAKSREVIF